MPVSARTHRAYEILAEREWARRELSLMPNIRYPSPENVFYSVTNSQRHKGGNRYSDILSYDRTSVTAGEKGYLNANVVCGANGHWWVAAQAPVPSSFFAYFHALYHQSASQHPLVAGQRPRSTSHHSKAVIIVQLTDYQERGRPKADRYIPELVKDGGAQRVSEGYGGDADIYLETTFEERIESLSTTLTRALLYPKTSSGEVKGEGMKLRHFLFNAWPDHGVPTGQAVQKLKALVEHIGQERERLGGCEVWVHCSAGIGRTGAFLALSSILLPPKPPLPSDKSPLGPLPEEIREDRVAGTIDQMREYRGMLVQTEEQMQLVYDLTS